MPRQPPRTLEELVKQAWWTAATSATPGRGPPLRRSTGGRLPAERRGRRRQEGRGTAIERVAPVRSSRTPWRSSASRRRRRARGRARPSPSATSTASTAATRPWWPQAVARTRAPAAAPAVVLTFDPHPSRVLAPERAPATLMTLEQKAELLAALGVDRAGGPALHAARWPRSRAEAFARDVLQRRAAGARRWWSGRASASAAGAAGDAALLRAPGREPRLPRARQCAPVVHEGGARSAAAACARRWRAATWAGRGDAGPAVLRRRHGRARRRPRAHDRHSHREPRARGTRRCPATGSTPAGCACGGRMRPVRGRGVNVGRRPTFGGGRDDASRRTCSTSTRTSTASRLRLAFQARLRGEQRFAGPEALWRRSGRDIAAVRARAPAARSADAI